LTKTHEFSFLLDGTIPLKRSSNKYSRLCRAKAHRSCELSLTRPRESV